MKRFYFLASLLVMLTCFESFGQYGMPMGRGGMMGSPYGNPYGNPMRGMNQFPSRTQDDEPLTAEDIVELSINRVKETIEINAFEEAVLRSIMLEATKKRIELQILKLEPNAMKTALEEIESLEDARLENELPPALFEHLKGLKEEGNSKTKRKKEKKKKLKTST
jgi:hypothetical protein